MSDVVTWITKFKLDSIYSKSGIIAVIEYVSKCECIVWQDNSHEYYMKLLNDNHMATGKS